MSFASLEIPKNHKNVKILPKMTAKTKQETYAFIPVSLRSELSTRSKPYLYFVMTVPGMKQPLLMCNYCKWLASEIVQCNCVGGMYFI